MGICEIDYLRQKGNRIRRGKEAKFDVGLHCKTLQTNQPMGKLGMSLNRKPKIEQPASTLETTELPVPLNRNRQD